MSIAGPPAIGKGDRVRVVRGPYDLGMGKPGEVVDINLGLRLVDFGAGQPPSWCHESYLDRIEPDDVELALEPPEPPGFTPGQRVRVTSDHAKLKGVAGERFWEVELEDGTRHGFRAGCLTPEPEQITDRADDRTPGVPPAGLMRDYIALTDDVGAPAHYRRGAISAFGTVREGENHHGKSWILIQGGAVAIVLESPAEIAALLERPEER